MIPRINVTWKAISICILAYGGMVTGSRSLPGAAPSFMAGQTLPSTAKAFAWAAVKSIASWKISLRYAIAWLGVWNVLGVAIMCRFSLASDQGPVLLRLA